MKNLLYLLFLFTIINASAQDTASLHRHMILADTHNDALSNQIITGADLAKKQSDGNFDLVRAKQGGLDVQVFSIWCGPEYGHGSAYAFANREIDSLYALIRRNPDKMQLVKNAHDLAGAVARKKMAALIGVEGGHMIEDRLDYIDSLAKRGMRYLTLTWNNSTPWATSAKEERFKADSLPHLGLTDFGKDVVHRLNSLGVMVDVSHVGEHTFYDVLATTTKPVIASHSCAYALCPHQRNLKDDQLKALAKNGGIVFVNFYSGFLDSTFYNKELPFLAAHKTELDSLSKVCKNEDLGMFRLFAIHKAETDQFRPPLSLLIKHIDYMVKLIGAEHVGIGSDFDGAESFPLGMDSVADYPKITAELMKLNYSNKDIQNILGGNFIKVLMANTGK
jgi:membrane dipeptidase